MSRFFFLRPAQALPAAAAAVHRGASQCRVTERMIRAFPMAAGGTPAGVVDSARVAV